MNYQLFSKESKKRRKKTLALSLLVTATAIFLIVFFGKEILWSLANTFDNLTRPTDTETKLRIADLEERLAQDSMEKIFESHLREENLIFKNEGIGGDSLHLATIVRKPPISPFGTILIEVNGVENVEVGDLVYKYQSFAIGSVEKIEGSFALVHLFSKSNKETVVSINGIQILLNGKGSGMFKAIAPRGSEIAVGDIARLPILESGIVAIVADISADPQDPELELTLQSPININAVEYLTVKQESAIDTDLIDLENENKTKTSQTD